MFMRRLRISFQLENKKESSEQNLEITNCSSATIKKKMCPFVLWGLVALLKGKGEAIPYKMKGHIFLVTYVLGLNPVQFSSPSSVLM